MKKVMYVTLILAVLLVGVNINTNVYASKHTAGEVITEADGFIDTGASGAAGLIPEQNLKDLSDTVYNILLVVAIVVAVLLGAILGLKFITEGVEGKAEVMKSLIPYVVGCVVVFGSFTIWKIVVTVLQGIN